MTSKGEVPFRPPPYPYDKLDRLRPLAAQHPGGVVDLSVGTPTDPAAPAVIKALGSSGAEHGYPWSVGSPAMREAAAGWMARRLGVVVPAGDIAACVGTKEFVATLPRWLALRDPTRDTILYPAISYPTYQMGAVLGGCRAVPVAVDDGWRLDLDSIAADDARRALCLWVNTPANPTGAIDDVVAAAEWGRSRGVPVFSDECYVEFTWEGPRRTVLAAGNDGVVAVQSLSKRSNLAGVRVGFYAGDPDLVGYLREVRKHAGLMASGPGQAAAVVALEDDAHVEAQAMRYRERLEFFSVTLQQAGFKAELPPGGFYLWVPAPDGDAWALTEHLARDAGALVSPGEFYGPDGAGYVRVALVQPMERLELVAERLAGAPSVGQPRGV
jgi:succinyldiaminopimelate transaminase